MPPFPQFNVVTSLCLERPSKKKQPCRFGCWHALGNNIDQGGAGGSGAMWQHVGGLLFFKEPGEVFLIYGCANTQLEQTPFCICQDVNPNTLSSSKLLLTKQRRNRFVLFGLWMCKRKLELIPFCTCQNPNPNTLSSSQLLPTNKEATLQHLLRMWAKIGDQKPCVLHGANTNVECASPPSEAELQHSGDKNIRGHKHRVLHSARTVHAQCTLQCAPQCTATKCCKYNVFSQKWWEHTPKKKIYIYFCIFFTLSKKHWSHGIYSVLWPCTVACTVQNTQFVQFCFWRRGGTVFVCG